MGYQKSWRYKLHPISCNDKYPCRQKKEPRQLS